MAPKPNPLSQALSLPPLTVEQAQQGVYMGERPNQNYTVNTSTLQGIANASLGINKTVPTFVPQQEAWRWHMNLDANGQKRFNAVMDNIYGKGKWGPSWTNKVASTGVQLSQSITQGSGDRVTPLDALEQYYGPGGEGSGGSGGGGGGGGYSGPTTTYQTSVAVSLTNKDTATRIVDDALSKYLGREANAKERKAFLSALNKYEEGTPTTTSSVTRSVPGGKGVSTVSTSSKTTGGNDPTQFAIDWAQSREGSSEYAAATSMLDAFMGALENPMDVVT